MIYQINNLKFSYPNSKVILDDISFDIDSSKSYTVLGKNGVGKTTLLRCMLNELNAYQGEIKLNGKDIKQYNEKELAKIVAYVPQSIECTFDYTVYDYVLMGTASSISLFSSPGKKEKELVDIALSKLEIENLKDRKFNELSGGEKQKVSIARAIVNNPSVILFDEPCSHLDFEGQIQILRIIKELVDSGYAIIFTSHDPSHSLALNNEVILFKGNGKIEIGKADALISEDKLKEVYGKDIKIRYLEEFKRNVIVYPSVQ